MAGHKWSQTIIEHASSAAVNQMAKDQSESHSNYSDDMNIVKAVSKI